MSDKFHIKLHTAAYNPKHINTVPHIIKIIPTVTSNFYLNN